MSSVTRGPGPQTENTTALLHLAHAAAIKIAKLILNTLNNSRKKDPGFSMSGSFFLYIERKAVEVRPIIQRMLIMIYCAKCVYNFYKYDIILCIRN